MRRRIAVLTTGRQDYAILRSTLLLLRDDARFDLAVFAGGMHLSAVHGHTVDQIEADGLVVTERLDFLGDAGDPGADAARALQQVSAALARHRPEALVVLGDRSETCAAGLAATIARVPLVHLHGGEETEGAIDNALRHALTKLAHLHLVSHESHRARVVQMGEPADHVVVVGAAGLDNLARPDLPARAELAARVGVPLTDPVVVVTLHPTTLGVDPAAEVQALIAAMERVDATWVVTLPNADAGGEVIRAAWRAWAAGRPRTAVVEALGDRGHWGMLRIAAAVLGNSSSGIIEAPAAGLPVVNVGDRQAGRLRSPHITDVPAAPAAIEAALRAALDPERKRGLADVEAPYPRGLAGRRIVDALARWQPPSPPRKRFVDRPLAAGTPP